MKLTRKQFKKIQPYLPKVRGNVRIDQLDFVNALLYVAENGCKWRRLPKEFGNWHTVYMRMRRWAENGTLKTLFEALQKEFLIDVDLSVLSLDSTCVKVHPDGTGALKKRGLNPSEKPAVGKTQKFT